ncbi:hypothetical protein C8F01DRAFT_1253499 [Mycena amicta]|nr:hypothetical protein C8F01DRAFT_1253499 [Mycena amicta]
MLSPLNDLPSELLARILVRLPYSSLLAVRCVSKLFNASKYYADPSEFCISGTERILRAALADGEGDASYLDKHVSEPVKIHPAIQQVAYQFGHELEAATIDGGLRLMDLTIADDFFSIPATTMVKINIPNPPTPESLIRRVEGLKTTVKNPKGVRVIDFFEALVRESRHDRDIKEVPAHNKRAFENLNRGVWKLDQIYYENLYDVSRTGLLLSVTVRAICPLEHGL